MQVDDRREQERQSQRATAVAAAEQKARAAEGQVSQIQQQLSDAQRRLQVLQQTLVICLCYMT